MPAVRRSKRSRTESTDTSVDPPPAIEVAEPKFLAVGQRGGHSWCAWEATIESPEDLQVVEGAVSKPHILYTDATGYLATCFKTVVFQWLPVKSGPRSTSKARGSPLKIGEGRHIIEKEDGILRCPQMLAVAERVQSRDDGKIWYLVTWKPLRAPDESIAAKNKTTMKLLESTRFHNGDLVFQFAPSWIPVDDFRPHERPLLRYFYERKGTRALAQDKNRCSLLALSL
jgi:hypothetical protein